VPICSKTPERKESSAPRVRPTYCNPLQKHIVAGGRAEGQAHFFVMVRGVESSRGFKDPILPFSAPTGVQLAPTSPKLVGDEFSEVYVVPLQLL
jgi:hypothetical protein